MNDYHDYSKQSKYLISLFYSEFDLLAEIVTSVV